MIDLAKVLNNIPGFLRLPLLGSCLMALCLFEPDPAASAESRSIESMIEDSETGAARAKIAREKAKTVRTGESNYRQFCIHCHGPQGRGNGVASEYLFPLPRDLTSGIFKFRSTQTNTLPLDKDLFKTIKEGVPGTAMPAWGPVLSDEIIRALVEYLKNFSDRFHRETPEREIEFGLEPPFDDMSVAKGKELYKELRCYRCHGEEGGRAGFLEGKLKDNWGHDSYVYDLGLPDLYKRGASGGEIYKTLVSGMDGAPMGAYDYLSGLELWSLIHYLQSRFAEETSLEAVPLQKPVSFKVEGEIDIDPGNPVWEKIAAYQWKLVPIQTRKNPITRVRMRSIHNEEKIAFFLEWKDPTPDRASEDGEVFMDAAALQFAPEPSSPRETFPFFGMGHKGKRVNIWHWRADSRQIVGGKEGVSGKRVDPFREAAVEEITSEGFGALILQSLEQQDVSGKGVWEDGAWRLVLVRDLQTFGRDDIRFRNGGRVLLALALWDGSNRDKNANKMVSPWRLLEVK
ncbi:MAG: c-type cytochrome [Nitrospinae bacterium]|nr:c-type cytochrome [Nitrospinota bacterium]